MNVGKNAGAIAFLLAAAISLPARGPVRLENIRYYSYPEYTRVVLDLSGDIKIAEKVLKGGDSGRLFFDLNNCRFGVDYPFEKMNEIRIQSGNLQRIRIGKWKTQTIRVVFDFDRIGKYNRFYLTSPFRIVFDIYSRAEFVSHGQQAREHGAGAGDTRPRGAAPPSPASWGWACTASSSTRATAARTRARSTAFSACRKRTSPWTSASA